MKNFGLYDILGVLAPGSIMVVGIVALFPEALGLVKHDEFTAGEFGLVVLLSYAAGNLVAGLGNLLEIPYRWLKRRFSSTTFGKDGKALLSARQLGRMQTKLRAAGMLDAAEELAGIPDDDWQTLSREVYAFLGARKMTGRIDTFNAEYGMNRGVAAAFVALVILLVVETSWLHWRLMLLLLACAALAVYRMERFWRYYAKELCTQFLAASLEPPKSEKDSEVKGEE